MSSERLRLTIRGAVQGVGFRPFVHRLAREMQVGGWVRNEGPSVVLEAEGLALGRFIERLRDEPPVGARIEAIDERPVPPRGDTLLEIVASRERAAPPTVAADRVTCDACLTEVFDPTSRFFEYPFTSCTACGPRVSIVDAVPYDRAHTSMAGFTMCAACCAEYDDPTDRRLHTQTLACPDCGPELRVRGGDGETLHRGADALDHAIARLAAGDVVALKGLGGYQLLVDGTDDDAVARLRERKRRPHKPFAVLVADVDACRELAHVNDAEAELLRSPAGPIVLLRSRERGLSDAVHPHQADVGLMLPTTPLHALLAARVGRPLVCTSGNVHDEPLCIDDDEALERLAGIVDVFVTHDRAIRRAVDDSVARVVHGAPQVLRLGRGYAPLVLPGLGGTPALATGAHLKCALALRDAERVIVGPHVGDLTNTRAIDAMARSDAELRAFFEVAPERVACDQHPDYASTHHAREQGLPVEPVQHHVAHALAVIAEHDVTTPVLAVVWDGTGLGADGTIWGGEFLWVDPSGAWERVAHLRPFRLPGGDAAARDPTRALAGLMHELPEVRDTIPAPQRALLDAQLNAPVCTSAGRLFDGVAALLGHDGAQSYEGMAPSLLERDATRAVTRATIDAMTLTPGPPLVLDWTPTLRSLARARGDGAEGTSLAAAFHDALADAIVAVVDALDVSTVVLTGGCFQNRWLTEATATRLEHGGRRVLLSRRLPPNDGAIALGQLVALARSRA